MTSRFLSRYLEALRRSTSRTHFSCSQSKWSLVTSGMRPMTMFAFTFYNLILDFSWRLFHRTSSHILQHGKPPFAIREVIKMPRIAVLRNYRGMFSLSLTLIFTLKQHSVNSSAVPVDFVVRSQPYLPSERARIRPECEWLLIWVILYDGLLLCRIAKLGWIQ